MYLGHMRKKGLSTSSGLRAAVGDYASNREGSNASPSRKGRRPWVGPFSLSDDKWDRSRCNQFKSRARRLQSECLPPLPRRHGAVEAKDQGRGSGENKFRISCCIGRPRSERRLQHIVTHLIRPWAFFGHRSKLPWVGRQCTRAS